ncbi:MAG TPA: TIGR02757 family protein [Vicinamibacterales bacterium]|nr:TIGR02757 family protein [Vicinamibacterales bacterium]
MPRGATVRRSAAAGRRRRSSRGGTTPAALAVLQPALDRLYDAFNAPDSARDPVQIVRRYPRVDDREVVAFIAGALAFGRVGSVMASVEAICRVLGPHPAEMTRRFEPSRDGRDLRGLVHRWTRGDDFVALVWVLRQLLETHGSLERAFAAGLDPSAPDVGDAIERFSAAARAVDLRPAYGRTVPETPGVCYFFTRPSTGSACKRVNLFLRWMSRNDGVDPGGWTLVPRRQLVVPLDTHTIRVGRCLRLTRRASPGWKMAAEITAALRALDPDDPVRYDFALCHLSMMGACGWHTRRGNAQCPLRDHCRPAR